jgi:hypothetical protein
MDWNAVGAIGEVGGAIGVIVTLIYLAGQLRQNTRAMRSSTYQTYSGLAMNISDYLAENAETFVRAANQLELSEADTLKYNMFAMKLFYQMETIYFHYKDGTVDRNIFDSRMRGFQQAFGVNPLMLAAWEQFRDWDLSDEFVRHTDKNVLKHSAAA